MAWPSVTSSRFSSVVSRTPLGQAPPQHVVLGVQELDLTGELAIGAAGEEHQQGLEEPGHAR